MRRRRFRLAPAVFLALAAALRAADLAPVPAVAPANASAIAPDDLQFFETKIRPLLVDRCYKCHSRDADKIKGGLMLDTR